MIFIDSREASIPIANAVYVDNLEAQTGADMMISRLSLPCKTHSLLMKHIESGSILIQLKIAEDLSASVGDRLNDSLARMRSVTKRTASHWLVFVGTLDCDSEGNALINGRRTHTHMSYAQISGAMVGWIARGGTMPLPLPRIDMLDGFCQQVERKLVEFENEQYKYVFNQQDMPDDLDTPLQIPVRVRDGRRVLIGFNGLGPELVNRIWSFCGGFKESLAFLTDPTSIGKLEGIGAKTIASIRKQCGLSDGDGYIGWNRDAVDTPESVAVANIVRSAEILARDTQDIFGKRKNGANK